MAKIKTLSNRLFKKLWLLVSASLVLAAGSVAADATYGSGPYGNCAYGTACSITVSSNNTVNVNVAPVSGGSCTIQSDSVSVLTDNTAGYNLTVTTSGTNTNLVNGANTISPNGGSFASPSALTVSSWGYRVDGLGSFGAGPTTAQSNVSPGSISSITFAAMAASNATPVTLANTSSPANPAQTTTVWYGVCAGTTQTAGTYSTNVTYTAVTN